MRSRFDEIQARAAAIAEYFVRAERRHQHQPMTVLLSDGKVECCGGCGETRHYRAGALVGFTAGARMLLVLLLVFATAACGPSSEVIPDPNPSTGSGHTEQDCGDPPFPGETRCIVRAPRRGPLRAVADLLVPSARAGLVGGNSGGHAGAPNGCPATLQRDYPDRSAEYRGGADPPPPSAVSHMRTLWAADSPDPVPFNLGLAAMALFAVGLLVAVFLFVRLPAFLRAALSTGSKDELDLAVPSSTGRPSGQPPPLPRRAVLAAAVLAAIPARAEKDPPKPKDPPPKCECPPPKPKKKPPVRKLDWVFLLLAALWAGAAQADERIGSQGEQRPQTKTEPHEPAPPKESTSAILVGERPPAPKLGTAGPPPAPTAADLLHSGERALRESSPALAHSLCAAVVATEHARFGTIVETEGATAFDEALARYHRGLLCQGRAALALNLPPEAEQLGRQIGGSLAGWVLVGDALRAQSPDHCTRARVEYQRVVDVAVGERVHLGLPLRSDELVEAQAAAAGLVACGGDWPKGVPRPQDLPQPSPWPEKRTGAEGGTPFRLDPCAGTPLPSLCTLMHQPLRLLAVAVALVFLGLALVQGLYLLRCRRGTP